MIPERFGRYEIQGLLGEGSMGRVFRAYDPLGQRAVAVKTLRPEYLTRDSAEDYVKRFRREAQAAGALSHPNIVTIYDVGEDYFVMELLDGITLNAILRERGKLPLEDVVRLLSPVAEALDYAHAKGVIHRDIKPGNIMVLPDGRPKLMDFGVAHIASTVMTAAGQFLGSPSYMSPEQIAQSEATPKTDLFSLAVVAYEMLTGTRPFEGDSVTAIIYRVVNEAAPPPTSRNAALPALYDEIFARALAKSPAQRFPSARTLVAALELKEVESLLALAGSATIAVPAAAEGRTGLEALVEARPFLAETQDLRASTAPGAGAPPWKRWRLGLAAALAAALALVALDRRGPGAPASPPPGGAPPALARLQIETTPPGAAVAIDGVAAGVSPLDLERLAPGTHNIRVSRDGFAPAELGFEVPAGASVPLKFSLQSLAASPASAAAATPAAAKRAPRVYDPGPGITPPRRVSGELPSYPDAARRLRLQGTVVAQMVVDERGVPRDIRIVRSAGAVLDETVIAALQRFRYAPATLAGKKIRIRHEYRQEFKLE